MWEDETEFGYSERDLGCSYTLWKPVELGFSIRHFILEGVHFYEARIDCLKKSDLGISFTTMWEDETDSGYSERDLGCSYTLENRVELGFSIRGFIFEKTGFSGARISHDSAQVGPDQTSNVFLGRCVCLQMNQSGLFTQFQSLNTFQTPRAA